ncbi:ATP-binding cassette domain-containing protein [Canibacter sp. lx-72]|uniref:ABC transporter ATP-binding protein n=1 Tax=Canibacter zhuwentaonis TaxID=2837491 RepID=UPI001BDD2E6B|nr:ATP-binding cassette domain-containing protein [Canibacter zhuwentaonis]
MTNNLIELSVKHKAYKKGLSPVTALGNFSLTVTAGERVAVVGESGVGKSTLLNILGLIDRKFTGSYRLLGEQVLDLSETELARWRNEKIGFVLQESALINSLSIAENITLPLLYAKPQPHNWRKRFDKIVQHLEIGSIIKKKPLECSGGEKARAVFARAIILNPQLILADEPTASLDEANRARIMQLLHNLNQDFGSTVITVTHNASIAAAHDRVTKLNAG